MDQINGESANVLEGVIAHHLGARLVSIGGDECIGDLLVRSGLDGERFLDVIGERTPLAVAECVWMRPGNEGEECINIVLCKVGRDFLDDVIELEIGCGWALLDDAFHHRVQR